MTKGMAKQEDLELIFVIPKPSGDEDQSFMKIIGANNTPIVWRDVAPETVKSRFEKYMVQRVLPPEGQHLRRLQLHAHQRHGVHRVLG